MGRALFVAVSGTDDTSLPTLSHAPEDAKTARQVFEEALDFGQTVEARVVIDPKIDTLRDALDWLAAGEGLSVFYYSGHGLRRHGQVALAAADSNSLREDSLLGASELARSFRYSDSSQLLVLLDCCFAEAIAVGIAGTVRDGGPSVFAIAAADILSLAHAENANRRRRTTTSPGLSPFTAALVVGLQGVASLGQGDVDLGDVFELISAESVRLGFPPPALLRSGTAREPDLRFRLPEDPRVFDLSDASFAGVSSADPLMDRPLTWVVGSEGRRSLAVAGSLANGRASDILDARDALTVDLSLFRLRGQKPSGGRLYIGVTSDSHELAREAASSGTVIAVTRSLPVGTVEDAVVRVPTVTSNEIVFAAGLAERRELALFEQASPAIAEYAGDSIERAVIATRAVLAEPEASGGSLAQRLKAHFLAETAAPHKKLVYSLLAFVSGSYLPKGGVTDYVATRVGLPMQQVSEAVAQMARAGVIQESGRWVRTIAPRRDVEPWPNTPELFAELMDHVWRHPRSDTRLQLMLAMASLFSGLVRSAAVDDASLRLLSDYGRDLIDCAGPANMLPLIEAVIAVRNDDVPSDIYVHKGDALRLSDDYVGAATAFSLARDRSLTQLGRLRADVGLMSAKKNDLTDEGLLRELSRQRSYEAMTPAKSSASVLAQSLHHYGNVQYAVTDWGEALDAYVAAERLLDSNDLSHSAILLDLWKGQADIHLHRGQLDEATVLLSSSLDLAGASGSVFLDGRAHAKLLQFAGDVMRHFAFEPTRTAQSIEVAQWWYLRSAAIYKRSGLRLGWLISRFRLHQSQMVAGRLRDAQFGFADLWREFARIPNPLWEFKSAVFICLSSPPASVALPALSEAVQLIQERLESATISRYQQQWGKVALASIAGDSLAPFATGFREIGANLLSVAIAEGAAAKRGCFY